jgi:hypothetical protein
MSFAATPVLLALLDTEAKKTVAKHLRMLEKSQIN